DRRAHRPATRRDPAVHEPAADQPDAAQVPRARRRRVLPAGRRGAHGMSPAGVDPGELERPRAEPLPAAAALVIVGGGVMGLAIAYQLTRRGLTDIVILERSYLAA